MKPDGEEVVAAPAEVANNQVAPMGAPENGEGEDLNVEDSATTDEEKQATQYVEARPVDVEAMNAYQPQF